MRHNISATGSALYIIGFLHRFLLEKGGEQKAGKLVQNASTPVEKSGFRKYNPFTDQTYGAKKIAWTSLVIDMIQMQKEVKIIIPKVKPKAY